MALRCAIIYDFDHTLSGEYQQMPIFREYQQGIRDKHQIPPEQYLPGLCGTRVAIGAGALEQMVKDARDIFPGLTNQRMREEFGPQIKLAPGLPTWFERINAYSEEQKLEVTHHVVSAGCLPLIEGTVIAPYLTSIHAGEFVEDQGRIDGIKKVVDPHNKIKEIKRICKAPHDVEERIDIDEYAINYDRVILFVDGFTDRDIIKFIRSHGGYAIGVYENTAQGLERAKEILGEIVHFLVPRDYSANLSLEEVTRKALDNIAHLQCDFDYRIINSFLSKHLRTKTTDAQKLAELAGTHLSSCQDCQYRSKATEVHPPRT